MSQPDNRQTPTHEEERFLIPPTDGHRWVSLVDGDGDNWLFDATFLLSNYNCIYGAGCRSIDDEPDPSETLGCCVHGAHLGDAEDRQDVLAYSALLDSSNWQHAKRAQQLGGPLKKNKQDEWATRVVDGACIFLNRAEFPGGSGCALHRAALEHDQRPLDWKPDVCWQVPIRLDVHCDENNHETVFVRAWNRHDWGGGEDFNWWCIEAPEAYSGASALYLDSRDELIELVGQELYDRLVPELELLRSEVERHSQLATPVQLTIKDS